MTKSIASGAKRGSVGTLILEALSTGDKYGWEIMKAIEEKSNGEYILKEPSLYSSLKRMEASGLVTSYWEDSLIGGRRHYYKITDDGLLKLNKNSMEWQGEKQFVNNLFEENTSNVDSSIKEINRTVSQVQKTVKALNENEKNIAKFILETEKDDKPKTQIIEQPVKAGDKLILPTVSPLQQDIFSVLQNKTESMEEIKEQKNLKQNISEPSSNYTFSKPTEKKEKYTNSPTNTYLQQDMFQKEAAISGMFIEKENTIIEPKIQQIEKEEVKEEPKSNKMVLQHIKSLATEKDFLDMKHSLKNKSKSFLEKQEEIVNLNSIYEKETPSLYGSFSLEQKEEQISTKFNNLGLEETRKAKQALEEVEIKKEEPFNFETLNKTTQKVEEEVDYKSILGELLTEDEQKSDNSTYTIKDLPRINVANNVNITLKTKKKQEEKEETNIEEPAYTYSYNRFDDSNVNNTQLTNEPEIVKPIKKELKNFHENLSSDEYSSSLLDDIYLENLIVRKHKIEQKSPLMATSYVSINKLNFNLSLALFIIMLIEIVATYIGLKNAGYIASFAYSELLFIVAGVLSIIPSMVTSITYLFSPLKKKEVNYPLLNKLGNNFIIFLISLVFIYAVNLFTGMNSLNRNDFIPTLVLPAVICFNLILVPILKFMLLKRKKYYI